MPEFKNSAANILSYAEIPDDKAALFLQKLEEFKSFPDQSSSDEHVRLIRKELTAAYYSLYKAVFFKTLYDPRIPDEILMFVYYGYIDEELAGEENVEILHKAAVSMEFDEECRIFPFYQWLRLIYNGKKDPSLNDFSVDYVAYLRQLKKEKRITESEERMLYNDSEKRASFELDNMFKSACRMMSSRITTFVPFFSSQQLSKPLDKTFLDFETLHNSINVIRSVDFSIFYRETVFTCPEVGIDKEFIQVEVLPDIILMPCIGGRGSMWQEITGAKRTTPGRFILPIMQEEDVNKIILKMCGDFRWELCKRVQGARWNDLTERSLTSDYVDYIDTYKKNRDLSTEAKERIKSALVKYRNSYKDMFTADYMSYILYESTGALRLNKAARFILFNYCPFSKSFRDGVLSTNPQYTKLIERYKNKNDHEIHLFDLSMDRITKKGKLVPAELKGFRLFLGK